MSNPPRNPPISDPRMDRREHHDGLCSAPSCEPSLTPVERPFTATQARNQLRASQEPLENIVEEILEEDLAIPENSPAPPSEPDQSHNLDVLTDLSNLDLQTLLLALAQQSVINCSFHQVFYYYSFTFLLLYFTIYSMGNSVTPCDLMRDSVTSKVMVMVTGHVTHSLVGSTG